MPSGPRLERHTQRRQIVIGVHLPLCHDGVYVPAHHRGRGNVGLYRTGILFEEPNPTGSRSRDLPGLHKTTETPEGTKRGRPKKPGGGRENEKGPKRRKGKPTEIPEGAKRRRRGDYEVTTKSHSVSHLIKESYRVIHALPS